MLPGKSVPFIIFAVACLVYMNALPGTFLSDDVSIVAANPLVIDAEIRSIFLSDYWGPGAGTGTYRPFTILSFAINQALFGPAPFSFHFINILLHAAISVLIGLVLRSMKFDDRVAWIAALLFSVHPIHGEVVNGIVSRSELFVAFFVMLSLWSALRAGGGNFLLIASSYAAALLSKEHAVVFLPLLVMTDAFASGSLRDALRRRWLRYFALLGLTASWMVLRHFVLYSSAIEPVVTYLADNPLVGTGTLTRMLTAIKVNLLYLITLLIPVRLQAVYSGPSLRVVESLGSAWGVAAVVYATVCVAAGSFAWWRRSAIGFGVFFYLVAFSVTSNFFFLTMMLIADRFAYLPSVGFCLVCAHLMVASVTAVQHSVTRRLFLYGFCGYVTFLGLVTFSRNSAFKDDVLLWESSVKTDPTNVRAWVHLGNAFRRRHMDAEAEHAYRSALEIGAPFPEAAIQYSFFLVDQGRPVDAIEYATKSIENHPDLVGMAQHALALAYLQLGRPHEALAQLDKIASTYGGRHDYWELRGMANEALGDSEGAIACYRRAQPFRGDPTIPWRLASLLMKVERTAEAEEILRKYVHPNSPASAHQLLGEVQLRQGKQEEAHSSFETAKRLKRALESADESGQSEVSK